jgi:hypothetical protein
MTKRTPRRAGARNASRRGVFTGAVMTPADARPSVRSSPLLSRCALAALLLTVTPALTPAGSRAAERTPRAADATRQARALAAAWAPPGLQPSSQAPAVSVSIDAHRRRAPVPPRFLGLSFELSSLRQIATYYDRGDFVSLLRSLGPGVLRFGGASADTQVAWTDAATPLPTWASAGLEVRELRELALLAAKSGWRVLLTIGMAHFEPQAAAREAAAAEAVLGRSLAGIELGNEPDAYARHQLRALPWTSLQYDQEVRAYREAIAALAPRVALAGPDVSGSGAFTRWGPREAHRLHPALLTGHHYPLGCRQQPPPSIPLLLSPQTRALERRSLARYLAVARSSRIPFRLTETNSVSCGGVAGISDTFASALWATDYLVRTMAAGADGINFHGSLSRCDGYSPLCAPSAGLLEAGRLRVRPEWYALLLATRLVGDRPVETRLRGSVAHNVDARALITRSGALHVLLVDDEPPAAGPTRVSVHVGRGFHRGAILALSAPSPAARSGVRLGGRRVGADSAWRPPRRLPHVPDRGGVLSLTLSPSSAELLTVTPRPVPRARHRPRHGVG